MKRFFKSFYVLCLIFILTTFSTGCFTTFISEEQPKYVDKESFTWQVSYPESETSLPPSSVPESQTASSSTVSSTEASHVEVHFIDVGQADSIFIQSDGFTMLIDAGTNSAGETVVSYLRDHGITTLDWVIGTHPHEDHIGGLDDVLLSFNVNHVMIPEKEHTTKTFEDVLDAIIAKDLLITAPVTGDTYELGSCSFTILGPVRDYGDELNNWSIAIKLICGDTSFIFSGDAEAEAELDLCNTGIDIDADVMKLGHHGSVTSSSEPFMSAISPGIIVISVGQDNDYGHPHDEIMEMIKTLDADIYRTDLDGNIVIESDGSNLFVTTQND